MNILARVKVWTFSMSGYLYLGRHWHSRRSNRGPGEWREKKGEEIRVVIKVRHSVTVGEQFACRSASRDKTLSTLNYFSCSGCTVDVRTNVHRSPQHWRHSGASHSHTMCVVSSAVKHCNSKRTSLLPARNMLQGIKQPDTASSMVLAGETYTIHPTSSL